MSPNREMLCRPAPLQVPRNRLECAHGGPAGGFRAGAVELGRNVIVNQRLLGVLDRAFHCLQLLGDLRAGPVLLDHFDDRVQVAMGALETLDDGRMIAVWHRGARSPGEDNPYPPPRIADSS